jgi:hypothetical protein
MAMTTENDVKNIEDKEKREVVNKFRYEVASEIGVPMRYGTSGGTKYGSAGFKSGYLIQRMIEAQEKQMGNQGK